MTSTVDLRRKVRNALLAMQRYSWEQGTAAQAFLESGDSEMVVLLAREAVVRQLADGRAAHGKVDSFGFVQGVCASPHFDRPGTASEGQAFFLLMEAAADDLGASGR